MMLVVCTLAAISWACRRGPLLPSALVHRLFREEAIRVWEPDSGQVKRIRKDALLPSGSRLLFPKGGLQEGRQISGQHSGQGQGGPFESRVSRPSIQQSEQKTKQKGLLQRKRAIDELKRSVLVDTPDYLVLNKPEGLAVQGGTHVALSIDSLLLQAFEEDNEDKIHVGISSDASPTGFYESPRLVHRLDKKATGALLIAKNANAAARLSAAFRSKTHSARNATSLGMSAGACMTIDKEYLAVVCVGEAGNASAVLPRRRGTITGPVDGLRAAPNRASLNRRRWGDTSQEGGAVTRFAVLETNGPFALLRLKPITGRKHQLRVHCARDLAAPIVGDDRYGAVRSSAQLDLWTAVERLLGRKTTNVPWGSSWPPLLLHCRSLAIKTPSSEASKSEVVRAVAPMPVVWTAVCSHLGWELPSED